MILFRKTEKDVRLLGYVSKSDRIMDHGLRIGSKIMNSEKVIEIVMMNFKT